MAFSKARRLANLMSAGSNEIPAARRSLATDSITKAMINDNVIMLYFEIHSELNLIEIGRCTIITNHRPFRSINEL